MTPQGAQPPLPPLCAPAHGSASCSPDRSTDELLRSHHPCMASMNL